MNTNAAGIDVGATAHFVAVPADRDAKSVREFGPFTNELYRLAEWLRACGIETVALESTGVYWSPLVRHEALLNREGMKGPLQRAVAAVR